MSLLSTDITKVKRLSLRDVKLPAQKRDISLPISPKAKDVSFNFEYIEKPIFKALSESFGVSYIRDTKILRECFKYSKNDAVEEIIKKIGGTQNILSKSLIYTPGEDCFISNVYTGSEIIKDHTFLVESVLTATVKGVKIKAEKIFNKMLDAGTIKEIGNTGYYYLSESTPF